MKQTFQIATPSLAEFTNEIVRLCKDGWELDNENVAHTAHNYGNLYAVTLVKSGADVVTSNAPDASSPSASSEASEQPAQQTKRVPPRRKQQEEK